VSRAKARARVYRSVEELPEVLRPGKYIVAGHVVEVYESVPRDEIVYQFQKTRELLEKYGTEGWV
jgi:hypothetical protein